MNKNKSKLIRLNKIEDIKKFANIVVKYESEINIYCGSEFYDAKSIMAIFALDTSVPRYVEIMSDDEEEVSKFLGQMEQFTLKETENE